MSGMITGHAPSGGAQLYYSDDGDGPAVLFIHAGVADSRMWRAQMELEGYRTVAFDQRGFGKTVWVPEPYADWKDAVAVLDELGIPSATIVGCSLGGSVALHLALAAPERVSSLVLVGAAAGGWQPADGWPEDPLWDEAVEAFNSGDLERVVDIDAQMWLAGPRRSLGDIDPGLIALFREMDGIPAATEAERNKLVEKFEPPTNDRLGEIDVPTLVVVGEYDVPDLIESAHYLAGELSDIPAVVIERAAHLPSLEQPDVFNQALLGFLSTL